MTTRIIPFDAAAHKVANVLLPWLVNGTLDGDELALVQRHVDECPGCRQEVEWLRELHAACIAGEATPGASAAFRNLRREMEAPRKGRDSIAQPRLTQSTPRWWQWAVAAQFAVIIVLGGLLVTTTEDPVLYRTLGAEKAAPATGSLVVVFDPATSVAEVQRILRSAGARVVDGPTQANAYVLEIPPGQTERAVQTIKAERATLLIEPLAARGAR